MLNLAKFYRIKTWYKNMGMAAIGVLAAPVFDPVTAFVGFLQVFLVQLHSFSMNNYYDAIYWSEDNYTGELLQEGVERWKLYLLGHAPLILALLFFRISGVYTWLLVVYAVLFYLYQGPLRLKKYWTGSIVLNSVPLGLIVFLHPYLVAGGTLELRGIFFSIMFTFYMAFYEIAHQIEHNGEDKIYSVVDRFGEKRSVQAAALSLSVPSIAGVSILLSSGPGILFTVPLFFLAIRLAVLRRMEDYSLIRQSWHKFYAAPEGGLYLAILLLMTFIP